MIKPLEDHVLIQKHGEEKKTESGIIVNEKGSTQKGTVLAVGPDVDITKGDIVLFKRVDGIPIEQDGIEYLVMSEAKILGVYK